MGGVMNGMALHGGVLPIGGTFLVFSDYMRPSVRLAALCTAHVIYSWSHDSVGLGEDGPTHQPVEHLAALRAIPDLCVIRPADANETAQAWRVAVDRDGPVALILTRQDLPVLEGTEGGDLAKGAYVLADPDDGPDVVLVGTGSEVSLCLDAAELLAGEGIALPRRVDAVLGAVRRSGRGLPARRCSPPVCRRSPSRRRPRSAGSGGSTPPIGLDRFGASAPGKVALERLGFTPIDVAHSARALLA